jgi:hypothetical protein
MDDFRFFNPEDFKRWMKKHDCEHEEDGASVVGSFVEPKYCGKKTARQITLESGKASRVIREFIQQGGIIKEADGDEYLVEVQSGSFYINKKNVIY